MQRVLDMYEVKNFVVVGYGTKGFIGLDLQLKVKQNVNEKYDLKMYFINSEYTAKIYYTHINPNLISTFPESELLSVSLKA